MKTTKSIILTIYWGARSINLYSVIGVLLYPFAAFLIFYSQNAPGQVRVVMILMAMFSMFFGGKLLLKNK